MLPERWQQVEQLCQAALDCAPDQRAAFLDQACAADEPLRQEVESLLAYQDRAEAFIEKPALQLAAGLLNSQPVEALLGHSFSHYQILSLLGRGGMGEVYLAQDEQLRRKVALKVLPAVFTQDAERVRRFEQEARAASALNHPNIITIYEVGRLDHTHFIATEFVEGRTLSQMLAEGHLQQSVALDVTIQVASGLVAAHAAGIIHRDIKPGNLMVRPDGLVKVLDFGLARVSPSQPILSALPDVSTVTSIHTTPGIVMGTVGYMSPEQARGFEVDARSDLFSLGVLLYEMLAGRAPFTGATTADVIAALLQQEPPPLAEYVPEIPGAWDRIVAKALSKEREQRYQSAEALLLELKRLKQELTSNTQQECVSQVVTIAPTASHAEHFVTLLKRHQHSALTALAVLLLTISSAFFYFNRPPALSGKDTILLADFANTTGDEVFDGALKQALAVQLEQSPFLSFFPEERVQETLRFMGRAPDERVTRAVAREICQRRGLKALLLGSIASLGRNYVVTLEAINGQSDETIARQQVEAEGKEQVLRALGKAASQLRGKLGESLASVQKFHVPEERITTSSLEAFKALSLGIEQQNKGQDLEAIPFYKRALELDPDFAAAYSWLGGAYNNSGQPELAAACAEKAFALRDRVSEPEKLAISASYYADVTGEFDKAIEVLKIYKQTYPRYWVPPAMLAGQYITIGQYEKSIEESRAVLRLDSNNYYAYGNLASAFTALGRLDEAKEICERAQTQQLDDSVCHHYLYVFALIRGDTAAMKANLDWVAGKPEAYLALYWQAQTAAASGQLRQANAFSGRAIALATRQEMKEMAASFMIEAALRKALFGLCPPAKQDVAKALAISRSSLLNWGVPVLPGGALALALCGEIAQAQTLADKMAQQHPKATLTNAIYLPVIRAAISLQRGDVVQAIQLLQVTEPYEGTALFWPNHLRGQAYLRLGKGAEAAAEFQKMLDHQGWDALSAFYPLAQLGLARASALRGDLTKSRKAYQDFFTLWKGADADLPLLLEAQKEYARLQ